jgi:glycosyltransferase involved in cell wall biosynthesis
MKVLVLYDYPPSPGGLATQGDLLYKGLLEMNVEAHPAHFESAQEKEWYYRWFNPDIVVGVGYWGHTPQLILHPQRYGIKAVPWLVADGYIANYQEVLNSLPLILVTSNWVKEMYVRDGISGDIIEVLPVGCDTDSFVPYDHNDPKIQAVRQSLGISPDQLMLLTVGGDAASKGAQEVMLALSIVDAELPDWKYVCKVWPQPRTKKQNLMDLEMATRLGIEKNVTYATNTISRTFMPYLIGACDVYTAPSRLEGFGMPQIEAGACGKPVIGIRAMGMLDTLVHEETAMLAGVAQEILVNEVYLGHESGFKKRHKEVFDKPRVVDYRANVQDIAEYLLLLMKNPSLRQKLGEAGRNRVVSHFDYRIVAKRFVQIVNERLGIY